MIFKEYIRAIRYLQYGNRNSILFFVYVAPALGFPLHFSVLGQINRQIRFNSQRLYLETMQWRVLRPQENLSRYISWINVLGDDARHLRRLRLHCGEGCIAEINLVKGERSGYVHKCASSWDPSLSSLTYVIRWGYIGLGEACWFDSYLEKEIVRPLMKRIEQNKLRGEDMIDALRKIVQDVPLAFDCTSSGALSDRMNLFPNH